MRIAERREGRSSRAHEVFAYHIIPTELLVMLRGVLLGQREICCERENGLTG